MFLFRWAFTLFLCVVLFWFATAVPLGKRPLLGHLRAIFATQEAHDLADVTREEAAKVADRVRQELSSPNLDGGIDKKIRTKKH